MRVLVTGAEGFIGRNLTVRLAEAGDAEVLRFGRADDQAALPALVGRADAVVHLAGENRPSDPDQFAIVNTGLTERLARAVRDTGRPIPILFASSIQAVRDNDYGRSKLGGEVALRALAEATGNPVVVFRLPNVFGKWCRPNYNSAVATFCHNIARGLPIQIADPLAEVRLVHIDDVVDALIATLAAPGSGYRSGEVSPEYRATVGELAATLRGFADSRHSLVTDRVGTGFTRALYATYVSYLPVAAFSYSVPVHGDPRGVFVEMLKTPDCGQFSFFTSGPGITRGGHYHHTKTEKFLVLKGRARFRFRHLLTGELATVETTDARPEIVETVPGWTHDITNIGEDELVAMLWANEVFDRARPDTVARSIDA